MKEKRDKGKIYLENVFGNTFTPVERYGVKNGFLGVYGECFEGSTNPFRYVMVVSTDDETFTDIYPVAFKKEALDNLRIIAKLANAKKIDE